ncbi:MAG TPA: TfoX/Sxy family protein [Acidimicrobiia bacterium]|nr:TfoX/Sxy family protein [Acidimicrobiia bacterium]
MAYDEALADEVRVRIGTRPDLREQRMFGGIGFMIGGNLAVGISGDELMVRVGKDAHEEAEALPGARTFDMGARPMRGWISVAPEGFASDAGLDAWVARGVAFAESLPPK